MKHTLLRERERKKTALFPVKTPMKGSDAKATRKQRLETKQGKDSAPKHEWPQSQSLYVMKNASIRLIIIHIEMKRARQPSSLWFFMSEADPQYPAPHQPS
jgi:hypothetical protein